VVLRATGRPPPPPPPPPIRVACSVAARHVADPTGRRRYAYAGVQERRLGEQSNQIKSNPVI
jgi:hypothetical protein